MNNLIDVERCLIFSEKKIVAGVTKRCADKFGGFGLTFSTNDFINREVVDKNIGLLALQLGVARERIIFQRQTHSDKIRIVDNNSILDFSDAMITNVKDLCLCVRIADCAGVLIYDEKKEIICAVHSGWRGTSKNIVGKSIMQMSTTFGSNPKDLLVYISPCASVENYEVGKEFLEYFPESTIERNNKFYFDNKKQILLQLINAGVALENIEISPKCTIADRNFHSYRRDKEKSGRMCAFIMMKSK